MASFLFWVAVAVVVLVLTGPGWAALPVFLAGFSLADSRPATAIAVLEADELANGAVLTTFDARQGEYTTTGYADGRTYVTYNEQHAVDARRRHKEVVARLSE